MWGRMAIRTDIDRQHVLLFGTPAQVKKEIQRIFEACDTPNGDIIARGETSPDVPLVNIRVMYEAFREYGTHAE